MGCATAGMGCKYRWGGRVPAQNSDHVGHIARLSRRNAIAGHRYTRRCGRFSLVRGSHARWNGRLCPRRVRCFSAPADACSNAILASKLSYRLQSARTALWRDLAYDGPCPDSIRHWLHARRWNLRAIVLPQPSLIAPKVNPGLFPTVTRCNMCRLQQELRGSRSSQRAGRRKC
jgi:hypothetical protein